VLESLRKKLLGLVDQNSASWNQVAAWLKQIEGGYFASAPALTGEGRAQEAVGGDPWNRASTVATSNATRCPRPSGWE
jgi:hypothetical protein